MACNIPRVRRGVPWTNPVAQRPNYEPLEQHARRPKIGPWLNSGNLASLQIYPTTSSERTSLGTSTSLRKKTRDLTLMQNCKLGCVYPSLMPFQRQPSLPVVTYSRDARRLHLMQLRVLAME